MVSLADDSDHRGHFFDEQKERDEDAMSESMALSLIASGEHQQGTINTTWLILIEIVLLIGVWVSAFLIPQLCTDNKCGPTAFGIILYICAGVWFIQLLIDRYYRNQHYRNRLCGYLTFYRKTRNIRRLPLLIASAANAILLIAAQVIWEKCEHRQTRCGPLKSPAAYLQVIISLSCAAQIILLIIYSIRTINFNKSGVSPDVNQEEMVTSFLQTNSHSSDVGFRDESLVDQVLERQADMIRYLKHHNTQLGKRISTLSDENTALKQRR